MIYYYVYILLCQKDKSLYVGFTTNLKERFRQHQHGKTKTTRERGPVKLIYAESYINEEDAKNREKFLKSGRGREIMKKQLKNTLLQIKK